METLKEPGRHADGGGLYLVVDKSGAKRWVFMSWAGGRQIEAGLGGLTSVSLAMARARAEHCRKLIAEGRNPVEARKSARAVPTFGELTEQVISSLENAWRNEKHRAQWRMTLSRYASALKDKRVDTITTEDVLQVLRPIWGTKAETASRLRGRIEKVLDAAKANGFRTAENPAQWRGHLDHLLPKRQILTRGHHAAMPWRDVPAFVGRLRARETVAGLALEFVILTAARSGEALGARWEEIDLNAKVWTIPAARKKAAREQRVPLSPRVLKILALLEKTHVEDFVFQGSRPDKPLSGMAMQMVLRRMKVTGVTVHGFRSSFRDWVGEATNFPREVAEAALAHTVGDKVERAYRRSDALEKRRKLMEAWAQFCEPRTNANVVPMRTVSR